MNTFLQDLRYSFRLLLKSPSFTAVAVLTLALGIGANTAIFTVVNALLLRSLPYRDPNRLVMLWENHQARGGPEREWTSPALFSEWRAQSQVFESMSALQGWAPTLTGTDDPEQLVGGSVSYDMFSTLGITPIRGRAFRPEEDQPGAAGVVLVSQGLWQRRFGADPNLVGKAITLGGDSYTVVGILPADMKFPLLPGPEIWRPIRPSLNPSCGHGCLTLRVIARLKPEVPPARAQSDLEIIVRRTEPQYPHAYKSIGVTVVSLQEQLIGSTRRGLLVLLGAVGFVLLIACANVANLMLARAMARTQEIALRTALGASRWRVVRQLLTESLLLALLGGALGTWLAFQMVDLLLAYSPPQIPRVNDIVMDHWVLGFTLGVSLLTGLIFGLAPALQMSRADLQTSLRVGGLLMGAGCGGRRVRGALVIAEVALALVLLIGAGLLLKSFARLLRVDPGFNPDHVLTLRIALPRPVYPEPLQVAAFYAQLLDRLRTLPGVRAASAVSSLPMGGTDTDVDFFIEGRPRPGPGQSQVAWYSSVSSDYFRTMSIRLVKGRVFTEQDRENAPLVLIINETMARRYWPQEDPIGRRLRTSDNGPWREIVGVVADIKHFGLASDARPSMYVTDRQAPVRAMSVVVRTVPDPLTLATAVRHEVSALDKNLAASNVRPMEEVLRTSLALPRFLALLLSLFAMLALILAAVGIYGVISYAVSQRTQEIGIRMALGAQPRDVLRLVLRQGMVWTLAGVGLGLAGALAVSQVLSRLLFEVRATDPTTFAALAVLLSTIAGLACYIPARRATKVDPLAALRYE